ncbi:MAG: hypothetical protein ABIA63_07960, partial [bacterium]
GISVIPFAYATLNKSANSLSGTMVADLNYATVLTLGKTYSIPGLPFAELDAGVNLKYLSDYAGTITMTAANTGTETSYTGSGYGLDVGIQGHASIPLLTEATIGIVAKNLFQSVNYSGSSYTVAINPVTGTITKSGQTALSQSYTYPTVYGLGVAGKLPGRGTILALDIESVSGPSASTITHFGIEQPIILDRLTLRVGTMSGTNLSLTTLGASVDLVLLKLNAASVTDNNNSLNSSIVIDAGTAF